MLNYGRAGDLSPAAQFVSATIGYVFLSHSLKQPEFPHVLGMPKGVWIYEFPYIAGRLDSNTIKTL